MILSGNILEVFTYENGYSKGLQSQSKSGRASKTTTDETKKENREKVMYRARSRVRRLANANPQLNKFFTLTFKENLTDLKYTNNEYKKFVLRLNRFCKIKVMASWNISLSLSSKSVVLFTITYFAIFRISTQNACGDMGKRLYKNKQN